MSDDSGVAAHVSRVPPSGTTSSATENTRPDSRASRHLAGGAPSHAHDRSFATIRFNVSGLGDDRDHPWRGLDPLRGHSADKSEYRQGPVASSPASRSASRRRRRSCPRGKTREFEIPGAVDHRSIWVDDPRDSYDRWLRSATSPIDGKIMTSVDRRKASQFGGDDKLGAPGSLMAHPAVFGPVSPARRAGRSARCAASCCARRQRERRRTQEFLGPLCAKWWLPEVGPSSNRSEDQCRQVRQEGVACAVREDEFRTRPSTSGVLRHTGREVGALEIGRPRHLVPYARQLRSDGPIGEGVGGRTPKSRSELHKAKLLVARATTRSSR